MTVDAVAMLMFVCVALVPLVVAKLQQRRAAREAVRQRARQKAFTEEATSTAATVVDVEAREGIPTAWHLLRGTNWTDPELGPQRGERGQVVNHLPLHVARTLDRQDLALCSCRWCRWAALTVEDLAELAEDGYRPPAPPELQPLPAGKRTTRNSPPAPGPPPTAVNGERDGIESSGYGYDDTVTHTPPPGPFGGARRMSIDPDTGSIILEAP